MEPEKTNLILLLDSICNFSNHDKELILGEFSRVDCDKNRILVRAGDTCKNFYFVNSGCLRTYFITSTGQERTRLILPPISIGTAFASFISTRESFEFLDCLENSTLLSISYNSFYSLLDRVPTWQLFYQKILEMAYIFQNTRIEQLVSYTAAERYALLAKDQPELVKIIPGKILASYLDISPETLSRLKSGRS